MGASSQPDEPEKGQTSRRLMFRQALPASGGPARHRRGRRAAKERGRFCS